MGGFSPDPFGGLPRLDRLDLRPLRKPGDSPDVILYTHVILGAANSYLYFALAESNGITLDEFWYAYEYFFNVRSTDSERYHQCKKITKLYTDGKHKYREEIELTPNAFGAMCFDVQYEQSVLQAPIEDFLTRLKKTRKKIVSDNWSSISNYFNKRNSIKNQNKLHFITRYKALTEPSGIEEVLSLKA